MKRSPEEHTRDKANTTGDSATNDPDQTSPAPVDADSTPAPPDPSPLAPPPSLPPSPQDYTLESELQRHLPADISISPSNTLRIPIANPFHDLTLTVGDKTFPCNALILSANSRVFKAMLEGQWKESKTATLTEEPSVQPHFESFLHFLYGAHLTVDTTNLIPLTILANKYAVWDLQYPLRQALEESVDMTNAMDMYKFSKKYNLGIEWKVLGVVDKDFLDLDPETDNDVEFMEAVLRRDGLEVKNEYAVFKKVVSFGDYLDEEEMKKLLAWVRFENVHPVDLVCKVLKAPVMNYAPQEVLMKIANVNFYRSLSLQPVPVRRRRYREVMREVVVVSVPQRYQKFSIVKEFPAASVKFCEEEGEIGFYASVKEGVGLFSVRLGILNILKSEVVGKKVIFSRSKDDKGGKMKGFRPFIASETLYHHGNGFISSDSTVSLIVAVTKLPKE